MEFFRAFSLCLRHTIKHHSLLLAVLWCSVLRLHDQTMESHLKSNCVFYIAYNTLSSFNIIKIRCLYMELFEQKTLTLATALRKKFDVFQLSSLNRIQNSAGDITNARGKAETHRQPLSWR